MTRLHTFVSQPMLPRRLLTKSPTTYPITAQLLHGTPNPSVFEVHGIHALLHRALWKCCRNSTSNHSSLTRFYYADAGRHSVLFNIKFESLRLLFPTLTHLDLCIGILYHQRDFERLRKYITTAKDLTHLRLCFEQGRQLYRPPFRSAHTVCRLLLSDPELYFPKLRVLRLSDMRTSAALLLDIVKRHARSLKSLRVDDDLPSIILIDLVHVAKTERLELEELIIVPSDPEGYSPLVFEYPAKESLLLEVDKIREHVRR
ncbi:hypothetical protein F4677DRAFT_281226 [Hypoxylon crocopeplum]|nr:hypothetical protein F4677DRAFT_281226 [Hypoxylon crocopeplum]